MPSHENENMKLHHVYGVTQQEYHQALWHYDNITPETSYVTSYHVFPTYRILGDGHTIRAVHNMLNQLQTQTDSKSMKT